MTKKQQNLWIVIAIVVVVLIVVMIALPKEDKLAEEKMAQEEFDLPAQVKIEDLPKAPDTEDKIDEAKKAEPVELAPGASPVTEDNEVLAPSGEVASNQARAGSADAPKPSQVLEEEQVEEMLGWSIEVSVTKEGKYSPDSFTVTPGQVVNLILTAPVDGPHSLRFSDKSMNGVSVAVRSGQSRAVTFKAPDSPGEYPWHHTSPGYKRKGFIGKMIVVAE